MRCNARSRFAMSIFHTSFRGVFEKKSFTAPRPIPGIIKKDTYSRANSPITSVERRMQLLRKNAAVAITRKENRSHVCILCNLNVSLRAYERYGFAPSRHPECGNVIPCFPRFLFRRHDTIACKVEFFYVYVCVCLCVRACVCVCVCVSPFLSHHSSR